MKKQIVTVNRLVVLAALLLLLTSCLGGGKQGVETAPVLPPNVKAQKQVSVFAHSPTMVDTGLDLQKGDIVTVLATGKVTLWKNQPAAMNPSSGALVYTVSGGSYGPLLMAINGHTRAFTDAGRLFLGVSDGGFDPATRKALSALRYGDNGGAFSVDIIVWQKEDYVQIADWLDERKRQDPQNPALVDAVAQIEPLRKVQIAQAKASQELAQLKEVVASTTPPGAAPPSLPPPATTPAAPAGDAGDLLNARMAQLTETMAQIEALKNQLSDERLKSEKLTRELQVKTQKEQELISRLQQGADAPPVIVVATPRQDCTVEISVIQLSGVAEDDQGLVRLEILVNGRPVEKGGGRGVAVTQAQTPKRIDFKENIALQPGANQVLVRATDTSGLVSEKTYAIAYEEKKARIMAVVIGINAYPRVRPLKYAVNDAKAFYDYLTRKNLVPAENITLLLDEQATLGRLRSVLGTQLKSKTSKDDMVIIFFAGHGATERDGTSPDGDGLEKYILPVDVDPKDLYATALPMAEIARIFSRIKSERLVFIADACYSGASGGRSIGIEGTRASLSDAFMDRVAAGKGRVILAASSANEVSVEDDGLGHGIFTHCLIEGLNGKADSDADRYVTVDEIYRYLSEQVPARSGQEQHPVKKGSVEGQLVLGVVPEGGGGAAR